MKSFHPDTESRFLLRCFDLARLGAGKVSPNPTVGAVLVYEGRIIGEGFHQQYGGAHAEVNALNAVSREDEALIPKSTLYVSLEPCCVFGKTPPCTDLILAKGIPRVVVSNLDRSPAVNGLGLQKLREAGVEVHAGHLETEGAPHCDIRNTFASLGRPYILLKYAQSEDGFLGPEGGSLWMTNEVSRRLVHKWRGETDAILVGSNTLLADNPSLTNRHFYGKSPLRLVLDRPGTLPRTLRVFDEQAPTWVFTENPESYEGRQANVRIFSAPFGTNVLPYVLECLAKERLTSLMVEGGGKLLKSLIAQSLWDEARVFKAPLFLEKGVEAPSLSGELTEVEELLADRLFVWKNPEHLR